MGSKHLKIFRCGNKVFEHYIDTDTDKTHIVERETAVSMFTAHTVEVGAFDYLQVRFTVRSDTIAKNGFGKSIGRFNTVDTKWVFDCDNGEVVETDCTDLLQAERKVFSHLYENSNLLMSF